MSLFCMNYVDEKDAPIQSPISSSRKPAERLRLEKEEQRNECALTFLIKKSEQAIQSLLRRVIAKHYRYRSKPQFAEKIIGRIYLPTSNL